MADLIDRDALLGPMKLQKEALDKIGPTAAAAWYGNAIWEIEQAPAVDAVLVRRGRWERQELAPPSCLFCSECGFPKKKGTWNFCPHCGADMREGEKDG